MAILLPGPWWLGGTAVLVGLALGWDRVRHPLLLRLRWVRAYHAIGLRAGESRRPRVVATRAVEVGDELTVQLPLGAPVGVLSARASSLAHAFGVRGVRVDPVAERVGRAKVTLLRRDPLTDPVAPTWPFHEALEVSLRSGVPVAVDGGARPIVVDVRDHLLLEGTGDDTFGALSLVLAAAAMDPQVELQLLDGREVSLSAWHDLATRHAGTDIDRARAQLLGLRDELRARQRAALECSVLRLEPEGGFPLILLAVHDLQAYLDTPGADDLTDLLRELVAGPGRLGIALVVTGTDVPPALRATMRFRWQLGDTLASRFLAPGKEVVDVRRHDLSEAALVALLDRARLGRAVWSDLSRSATLTRQGPTRNWS